MYPNGTYAEAYESIVWYEWNFYPSKAIRIPEILQVWKTFYINTFNSWPQDLRSCPESHG